jgi:hypothetical protein
MQEKYVLNMGQSVVKREVKKGLELYKERKLESASVS